MICRATCVVLLASAVLLTACQGSMRPHRLEQAGTAASVLNHGYALLHATLADESKVDQVLMIKDSDPRVAELLQAIAQFAGDGRNRLQAFAEEDPTLSLDGQGLPEVEQEARDAISGATAKQILFSSGKTFEFRLLMTQHQALIYITHLAATLSKQDTHEARKHYLEQLAVQSLALGEQVTAQLEAPYVGPAE
jgi:hypothetical protein